MTTHNSISGSLTEKSNLRKMKHRIFARIMGVFSDATKTAQEVIAEKLREERNSLSFQQVSNNQPILA